MARRILPVLNIAEADRERLVMWTRRQKSAQALALRSRIILACAEGHKNTQVAKKERTTNATVGKWRQRYVDNGIDGLMDEWIGGCWSVGNFRGLLRFVLLCFS